MNLPGHVSHYFERGYGPFLNICNLDEKEIQNIIDRESDAQTGFNRFSYGKEFFDFRKLADDLLLELYTRKFKKAPKGRPFYGVLGDADVVGGLYREPHKIRIPITALKEHELTFMCPDHFHLVGLSGVKVNRHFGYQPPGDYTPKKYPYFGQLMTCPDLIDKYQDLKIDRYLEERKRGNDWYRYIEAQIWVDAEDLNSRFVDWIEVIPEPWSDANFSNLDYYKK